MEVFYLFIYSPSLLFSPLSLFSLSSFPLLLFPLLFSMYLLAHIRIAEIDILESISNPMSQMYLSLPPTPSSLPLPLPRLSLSPLPLFICIHFRYGTYHFGSCCGGDCNNANGSMYDTHVDLSQGYHIYAVEWTPTAMTWYSLFLSLSPFSPPPLLPPSLLYKLT